MVKCRLSILAVFLLLATSLVGAQNIFCSVTPPWKVSSVTQNSSNGELLLAIETADARGMVQLITVSTTSGSTRYVTDHNYAGWTFAVHVQEDERRRTATVGIQAWCDGRMRGYDETVLPVQVVLDRI